MHISIHPMLLFIGRSSVHSGRILRISIHPMLLFIRVHAMHQGGTNIISIHPMLLFIKSAIDAAVQDYLISIHPMLLFILLEGKRRRCRIQFQYIPCYCLSYGDTAATCTDKGFQYIPCYCLSRCSFSRFPVISLFQYIPCYCLSMLQLPEAINEAHFNTSHVTVYLTNSIHFSCKPLRHFLYFTLFPPFLPAVCKI